MRPRARRQYKARVPLRHVRYVLVRVRPDVTDYYDLARDAWWPERGQATQFRRRDLAEIIRGHLEQPGDPIEVRRIHPKEDT